MRTNYVRIPFAALLGREEIPSLGSVLNREDYEGPRTTSASIAVAKHIRSFYRLFGTIGIISAISVFHIIAIIFGHVKRNACPAVDMAPKIIMIFGIIDLSICGIIIIIVIVSTMRCYHRLGLVYLLIFIGISHTMLLLMGALIFTNGNWMSLFTGSISKEETNCDSSIRFFVSIITIYRILSFFSPVLYCYIAGAQLKNERNPDSRVHFTTFL